MSGMPWNRKENEMGTMEPAFKNSMWQVDVEFYHTDDKDWWYYIGDDEGGIQGPFPLQILCMTHCMERMLEDI